MIQVILIFTVAVLMAANTIPCLIALAAAISAARGIQALIGQVKYACNNAMVRPSYIPHAPMHGQMVIQYCLSVCMCVAMHENAQLSQ